MQPDETDACTTADGLTLKVAVCITKNGLKKRWQPSIASRKTCATIIVSFAKKHGRCLLPERRYILARDARETRSRVDYILLNNDMDPGSVPAELQGLSKVEELLIARAFPIMSICRKHGGQRGYNGNVLNLPEDTQSFLNSLPPNVGGLPILVIRKQGAGKCL